MYDDQDIFVRGPTGGLWLNGPDLVNSTLFMATLAALENDKISRNATMLSKSINNVE
jgi:hypothetical protein